MGRTRRLDPPALVTHPSRGFGGQDLGTGRGSDGCHPVPFSRWRRERGPEAAVPPAPSWQPGVGGGGLRPEAGRIPGRRMGETAQGPGGACLLGRSELGVSCSGALGGGTGASSRCEFGELRLPPDSLSRVMEGGGGSGSRAV